MQANEIFTPIELDLSERYAQVIKTVYVGFFFAALVPLSTLFSMLGVFLEYIVTKQMLNKHPKPQGNDENLIIRMLDWLRYSLVVYSLGAAFFYF